MRVLSDLLMKSSAIVLNDDQAFPVGPRIGQFCFTGGILYIYATINTVSTWYPLTNRSLYYVHTQGLLALTWTVEHGLGSKDCIIMVYDENDIVQLAADFEFVDMNTITISLTEATKGRAIIFAAVDEYSASGSSYSFGAGFQFESNSVVTVDPAAVITRQPVSANANYTAFEWDEIYADTSVAAFDVTLPDSPSLGAQVKIVDVKGTFDTTSVTVKRPSGVLIQGLDEDLILDVARSVTVLCWSGDASTGWVF